MYLGANTRHHQRPKETVKIGAVAKHFGISLDLLRLYEREALVIPLRSERGTRYFTEQDYPWITMLLRLVREARLNFAAIRHLLALLPCWEHRKCGYLKRQNCPIVKDATAPCWSSHQCCGASQQDCYFCSAYRSAPESENLKALLSKPPAAREPMNESGLEAKAAAGGA